jgi:Flp pilus assembly protein TadG
LNTAYQFLHDFTKMPAENQTIVNDPRPNNHTALECEAMAGFTGALNRVANNFTRLCARFVKTKRANVAMMFAFMSPMLLGGLGLGMETTNWYVDQRSMQNASDAAALAAAGDATANYASIASAIAGQYGYQDGLNNVTVSSSNSAPCPSGGNNCYSVSITYKQPLYLMPVLGFTGNTTVNGRPAQTLRAAATAIQGTTPRSYCLLALNTIGTSILGNGVPSTNFAGCNTMSNASATCHGHDMGADYGDAHLTDSGCGVVQTSNVPIVPDPYAGLASNIPSNPCSTYSQEPSHHGDPALPASNLWGGSKSLSGNQFVCGDLQLTSDVTINAPAGTVLVIENGQLDTNGFTIRTASGSAATVVYSGDNSGTYTHSPTGGGTLDIQAPQSGPWSGVAMYQDPSLTSGVDMSAAGNSPTWNITGLVYMPHANVTFSGAVNKSSNGTSCFAMVVGDITINGTGSILAHGGCAAAGLSMPTGQIPGRGQLVS